MGLVDLKTNLKSLKASFSGLNTTAILKDIASAVPKGVVSEFTRRIDDVARVTKVMLPANSRFLLNQTLLSKVKFASQIESLKRNDGKTSVGAFLKTVKDVSLTPLAIAASTIAATAASGTGLRFVRGFKRGDHGHLAGQAQSRGKVTLKDDERISYFKDINDYSEEFGVNSSKPYVKFGGKNTEDRTAANLITEQSGKLLRPSNPPSDIFSAWTANRLLKLRNQPGSSILQNYNIPIKLLRDQYARNEDETSDQFGLPEGGGPFILSFSDFRKNNPDSISFNYNSETIEKHQRVGIGRKGYWNKPVNYTGPTLPQALDKLNAVDVSPVQLNGTDVDETSVRDLIKFRFEVLSPGKKPVFLYFRALLESFDDNFNGNWSDTNYIGRGDAVRTYNGFTRTVSLNFKIAATTRDEMKPLYRKMAYLASTTAPTYGEDGSFMKGTLVRMTIGSYIYEVAGTMDSVRYSWKENYPWEIAMQNPESNVDDDMQELPHMMDCSITFTPIHDFVPQTGLYHYITSPRLENKAKVFFNAGEAPVKRLLPERA